MRTTKPVLVVMGMMGRAPFAGVAWQVLHYLEGFRRLGYDVYYVEDTGDWPYDPEQNTLTGDCRYTTAYISHLMEWCGLPGRWAYRAAAQGGRLYGLSEGDLASVLSAACALVNLTGATLLREEHMRVPVRIYLETDPVLPQIEVAQGNQFTVDLLSTHTHHFTYGENIGMPGCGVPSGRFPYRATRQPVVLDWWGGGRFTNYELRITNGDRIPHSAYRIPHSECGSLRFTTIGSWRQAGKDVEWNGELYTWSKHHEFLKFLDVPRRTGANLELALACDEPEVLTMLASHGWRVVDALALSKDILPYRDFILGSDAEFTVAKDQNIRLRSGWFSDRSACYLAAGKPVITQDTGFGSHLPTGQGLFAFHSMDDIASAFEEIARDYERHSQAALEIAHEYFKAEKVLAELCNGILSFELQTEK